MDKTLWTAIVLRMISNSKKKDRNFLKIRLNIESFPADLSKKIKKENLEASTNVSSFAAEVGFVEEPIVRISDEEHFHFLRDSPVQITMTEKETTKTEIGLDYQIDQSSDESSNEDQIMMVRYDDHLASDVDDLDEENDDCCVGDEDEEDEVESKKSIVNSDDESRNSFADYDGKKFGGYSPVDNCISYGPHKCKELNDPLVHADSVSKFEMAAGIENTRKKDGNCVVDKEIILQGHSNEDVLKVGVESQSKKETKDNETVSGGRVLTCQKSSPFSNCKITAGDEDVALKSCLELIKIDIPDGHSSDDYKSSEPADNKSRDSVCYKSSEPVDNKGRESVGYKSRSADKDFSMHTIHRKSSPRRS